MSDMEVIVEPGKQEIVMTRVFNAPRKRVFEAVTDPKSIPKWWGPRRLSTAVDRIDARPGGSWRFLNREPDGTEYRFHGVYHDVASPERVVQTFEFEGAPGHVALETMTLEDLDGKTRIVVKSVFQSLEDRDAMVASGMEEGARETWDRLEELLTEQN